MIERVQEVTASTAPSSMPAAPGLARRLACFLYEGVLLFGVVMIAGFVFATLTQQRNALVGRHGLQAFLFVVLGIYFVWFWSHGGQTVAMKAWHIRLVRDDGSALGSGRALLRYLLSWLWFLPALTTLRVLQVHDEATIFAVMLVGALGYAALSHLRTDRQYWHDAVCGTRLVSQRPRRTARHHRKP